MSFLYDPKSKRPQIWTYPFFIMLAVAVFTAIYLYGENKSKEAMQVEQNAVETSPY